MSSTRFVFSYQSCYFTILGSITFPLIETAPWFEIAKFLNQKAIRLDVLCTNKPAIYLYEKCGFLLQGYQTMDYGEPVVAGLYERLI